MADDSELVSLLGDFQEIGARFGEKLEEPMIIVTGMQSAGKSSIVEALGGIIFNYCANDIASRFPLRYTMVNDPKFRIPCWEFRFKEKHRRNCSTEDVRGYVEQINKDLAAAGTVSHEIGYLSVRWARAPNITFIDLPGMRTNTMTAENRLLKEQIDSIIDRIVQDFYKNSDVTFVVVEDIKFDVSTMVGVSKIAECVWRHHGQNEDLRRKIKLVCHKFDAFCLAADEHTVKKTLETLSSNTQYETYVTALPTSIIKNELVSTCSAEDLPDRFAELIEESDEFARNYVERKDIRVPLATKIGFFALKKELQQFVVQKIRASLRPIKSKLETLRMSLQEKQRSNQRLQEDKNASPLKIFAVLQRTMQNIRENKCPDFPTKRIEDEYREINDQDSRSTEPQRGNNWFIYEANRAIQPKEIQDKLESIIRPYALDNYNQQILRLTEQFKVALSLAPLSLGTSSGRSDEEGELLSEAVILNCRFAFPIFGTNLTDWNTVLQSLMNYINNDVLLEDLRFFLKRYRNILKNAVAFSLAKARSEVKIEGSEVFLEALANKIYSLIDQLTETLRVEILESISRNTSDFDLNTFLFETKELISNGAICIDSEPSSSDVLDLLEPPNETRKSSPGSSSSSRPGKAKTVDFTQIAQRERALESLEKLSFLTQVSTERQDFAKTISAIFPPQDKKKTRTSSVVSDAEITDSIKRVIQIHSHTIYKRISEIISPMLTNFNKDVLEKVLDLASTWSDNLSSELRDQNSSIENEVEDLNLCIHKVSLLLSRSS